MKGEQVLEQLVRVPPHLRHLLELLPEHKVLKNAVRILQHRSDCETWLVASRESRGRRRFLLDGRGRARAT